METAMGLCLLFFMFFLLFIDEIQLGVCQTAVLDIAVFSTVFRIVFLYRCRYVWIIRSGLGAFARHTVRILSLIHI